MPIFELDEGRPVLVQPMQPAAASFGADSAALVADELGSLLGEQLFPVRPRPAGGADAPHLLALDAVGQPVVVEVVQVLDGDALVRALRYAGVAARLSPGDLSRAYHGGAERFTADFAAFRETVPVVATLGAPGIGSRLVLVCAEVDESVTDAVAFLRRPGRQVEVLQIGVVRGIDGRRYVDVSPLVLHVPTRRQVEPASLRLVHSSDAFAAAMAYDASRRRPTRSEPTPPSGMPASDLSRPDAQPPVATVPAAPGVYVPPSSLGAAVPPSAALAGPLPASYARAGAPPTSTPPAGYPATSTRPAGYPTTPSTPFRSSAVTAAAAPLPVASAGPAASPAAPDALELAAPPAPMPAAATPVTADPRLATLASGYQAPETLVWFRQRRGQRLVAVLRTDGLVQLPDGSLYADPDEAAARAAGAEVAVDGWGSWRLGDGGPTLAEATGRA